MKLDISFNKEGLTKAFKTHYDINYPIKSRLMLIVGLLTMFLGFVLVYNGFPENPPFLKHLIVFAGVAYIGLYFYRRTQLFKRASEQKTFKGNFYFELNQKGIAFGQEDKVSACEWGNVTKIIESQENILFYFGKDKFYILPIENVSQKDKEEIQKLIQTTNIEIKRA